ncbi:hypothetical protein E8E11_001521 [Didymella keratinophila]|nr:hypothetical protein E8E11_001521 [Didymella keratinophila]
MSCLNDTKPFSKSPFPPDAGSPCGEQRKQASSRAVNMSDSEDDRPLLSHSRAVHMQSAQGGLDVATLVDTQTSKRYTYTENSAKQKSWTEETTTVRTFRETSGAVKIGKDIQTSVKTLSVLARNVPKKVKRDEEWASLTDEERAQFNNNIVNFLYEKTRD